MGLLLICALMGMAGVEDIIQRILLIRPELSREYITGRLEHERRKTGGYISDEVLLQAIAAELGVEFNRQGALLPRLTIKSLLPGLGNVTITGRVLAIYPSKASGRSVVGRRLSLLIADKTGILRVVLWNDKAEAAEAQGLRVGDIVRLRNGYVREDPWGKLELQVGEKGGLEINPEDVKGEDYPAIEMFSTRIGEVTKTHKDKRLHFIGTVREVYAASAFQRQDGSQGKILRFILEDASGSIPMIVWNDKVEEAEAFIRSGVQLSVVNAKVKKALNGGYEAHVDSRTCLEALNFAGKITPINQLMEGMDGVNVEGKVAHAPSSRELKTSKGETVKLTVFEVEDATGKIQVSAWRKMAEKAACLKAGDNILIIDAYAKRGFNDKLELIIKNSSTIILRR